MKRGATEMIKKIALWIGVVAALLLTHSLMLLQGATLGFKLHSDKVETECTMNGFVVSQNKLIFACMFVGVMEQQEGKK